MDPRAISSYCSEFCDSGDHPKVPTLEPKFRVGSCVQTVPGDPRISKFRMVIGERYSGFCEPSSEYLESESDVWYYCCLFERLTLIQGELPHPKICLSSSIVIILFRVYSIVVVVVLASKMFEVQKIMIQKIMIQKMR